MTEKIIKIEGMACGHCSARVEKALNAIDGVSATVDWKPKPPPSPLQSRLTTRF